MVNRSILSGYFDFVVNIPCLDVSNLSADQRESLICKEPYNFESVKWRRSKIIHYPFILPCGHHHIGIHCLVQWMVSRDYNNHCPFDRIKIVPHSSEEPIGSQESPIVNMLVGLTGRDGGSQIKTA